MRCDLTAMDGWWPTCASQFQLHGDPFLVFETTWKQERTLASGQQIKVLVISGPPNPSPFNREIREIDGNRSSLVPKRLYHKHDQNRSKHNFSSLKPKTSSSRFTGQVHRFLQCIFFSSCDLCADYGSHHATAEQESLVPLKVYSYALELGGPFARHHPSDRACGEQT